MPEASSPAHDSVLERLTHALCRTLDHPSESPAIRFTRQFFGVADPAELETQSLESLQARALCYWQLAQEFDGSRPRVQVFNPNLEQHGWHCPRTVIQVYNRDMPFLVRSVRLSLERRGLSIHDLNNCVIAVVRGGDGQLLDLASDNRQGAKVCNESVIHLEVDRQSTPERLAQIRDTLLATLADVRAAVEAFPAMQAQAESVRQMLQNAGPAASAAPRAEAAELLAWLLRGNFVFLGYRQSGVDPANAEADSRLELGVTPDQPWGKAPPRWDDDSGQVIFGKGPRRSRVKRAAYPDHLILPGYDGNGKLVATHHFYGLFSSSLYQVDPARLPVVRRKVASVLADCGFEPGSYNHKELENILGEMPRDELLLAPSATLKTSALRVFRLREQRKACLLIRRDPARNFYSALYYVHRDLYTSALRQGVQELLATELRASDVEVSTRLSQSTLSCTHFMLYGPGSDAGEAELKSLQQRVTELSRSWSDDLQNGLNQSYGEEQGSLLGQRFRKAFPSAYREHFSADCATCDVRHLLELNDHRPVAMRFYRPACGTPCDLKFKLYSAKDCVVLSDVIPILENLGMRVLGEHPYPIRCGDGRRYWISDFSVSHRQYDNIDLNALKPLLQEAFIRVWQGQAENDAFNQLVIGAALHWREVALLRAYARYIKQLRFGFSQPFIAETLAQHPAVTRLILTLFQARFDPAHPQAAKRDRLMEQIEQRILESLEQVDNLDHDRILRRYLLLIQATLRTNYYQPTDSGAPKEYLAFKLNPRALDDIPEPRPMFEVFVYSPRVEGVHLRAGRVARGGLRWSDRMEDYRTEVLGLVKAQQVKNAVIVPMGAKGCFIAKQLPADGDREAVQAEGIACYQTYIRGLLDLTDNRVGTEVVPPPELVRHDDDDPYLVVAADKGTATFSDIANRIAAEYDFWLNDAFASGGSEGYDHKKMGITARGAWESVKRHFRERGLDVQSEPITVVGIGDMGGDVFGNGLLQSPSLRLLAAFNHQHIFVDPAPESDTAYAERRRLFALPRSSWADYNRDLISKGGGVFSRSAKWIPISPQMKKAFDIPSDRLTPTELIRALLKAPVDLLWNGGIGTYVKARSESHAEVGDKANDGLRINGRELRCRVLGEGGNLGFTQRGRIEFATQGGAANTDFIDNAGGVDCSDHEVNIKILLNELVGQGDLTLKQRNQLLREMTDAVAELVLHNNYRQCQALNIAEADAQVALDDYLRLIRELEKQGTLDRKLEHLPSDKELNSRKSQGRGLTRPELSVLISYVKIELKQALIDSWVTEDHHFGAEALSAFPQRLQQQFPDALCRHRLRREICATQIANDLVNRLGITFMHRLSSATGADAAEIAAAYLIVRSIYGIDRHWDAIEALDGQVATEQQLAMMKEIIRLIGRSCHWLLRRRRHELDPAACIARFQTPLATSVASPERLGEIIPADRWQQKFDGFCEAGAPTRLAAFAAGAESLYWLLDVIDLADRRGIPVTEVAAVYFALGEGLDLTWLDQQIRAFQSSSHWQALAIAGYRNELDLQLRTLTERVFDSEGAGQIQGSSEDAAPDRVSRWLECQAGQVGRWRRTLSDMQNSKSVDCAVFSVALNVLLELGSLGPVHT